MKKLLFSLFFLLATTALMAQAPQRISYQSIIRDANNVVVASSAISVKISLLRGTATGPAVYVETHPITTNANGLVSLNIGEGTAITGTFAGIDWSNGPYLIQTATDPTGGTDYSIVGTAPLNSVPYALYAANGTPGPIGLTGPVGPAGPTGLTGAAGIGGVTTAGTNITLSGSGTVASPYMVSANIPAADAATITGIIPVANGGTGETTVPGILSALGFASNNVAIGFVAGTPNQVVNANTIAIGGGAGRENQGQGSVAIGYVSGDQNQGSASVAIGGNAAQSGQGTQAVALGFAAGQNGQGDYSVAVGSFAGNVQAANSIALNATGASLNPLTTGFFVDPIINRAATSTPLYYNTTTKEVTSGTAASGGVPYTGATQAVDLGAYDLKVNGLTIGRGGGNVDGNTAYGSMSLYSNSSGNSNTAYGYASLYSNTTGSSNIANGNQSLYFNTTGSNNTAIGNASLNSNIEGVDNTANGFGALYKNTGSNNTASGSRSLYSNTTGGSNTALGYYAGITNTTGTQNTLIGYSADVSSTNLSNATALGNQAIVTASNTIQLGNTSVTNVKTSGTITAGTVTYPNAHNSTAGQALTTNALGVASWTTPAAELPTSGNTPGDMLYWNGSAWVKVAAGSNGRTLTFYNSAPVWVETTANANTVFNPTTGKIWMDRNLGATQVATSSTDAAAYGDLYQWGRGADGHQIRTPLSATTTGQTSFSSPGPNFFKGSSNWYTGTDPDNLWQGVSGVNNPCPTGYRIPTEAEWVAEHTSWTSQDQYGAFASPLKLPLAGYRYYSDGSLYGDGTSGRYWSSTVSSTGARYLYFNSSNALLNAFSRANGLSVRCLKD